MPVSTTTNDDGSANIQLDWTAYSQGTNVAHGLIIYWASMDGLDIEDISQANPANVQITGHGLSTGDKIRISGVAGMTEVNDTDFTITKVDADNFTLDGIDSSAYTAYSSGGVVSPGALQTTDKSTKVTVGSTSYLFEGVAANKYYRFGLAAYKTTRSGMQVGTITDHSSWKNVQPNSGTLEFKGGLPGKGSGNQRIVIEYENGELKFYDASDNQIMTMGANAWGSLLGLRIDVNSDNGLIYLNGATTDFLLEDGRITFGQFNEVSSKRSGLKIVEDTASHQYIEIGVVDEESWGYEVLRLNAGTAIDLRKLVRFKGTQAIDTDGYQDDGIKTRQTLLFGYNATIHVNAGGTTTVDSKTMNGATNGFGYQMIRSGKVTGMSVRYSVSSTGFGTFKATVQKNGVNQTMVASGNVDTADEGASSTSNSFSFAADDQINVELELEETAASGPLDVEDVSVVVEITA